MWRGPSRNYCTAGPDDPPVNRFAPPASARAFARIGPVLDTLKWLRKESDTWFEITNLLIPGENDSREEINRLVNWILENLGPGIPLHFTHPAVLDPADHAAVSRASEADRWRGFCLGARSGHGPDLQYIQVTPAQILADLHQLAQDWII